MFRLLLGHTLLSAVLFSVLPPPNKENCSLPFLDRTFFFTKRMDAFRVFKQNIITSAKRLLAMHVQEGKRRQFPLSLCGN